MERNEAFSFGLKLSYSVLDTEDLEVLNRLRGLVEEKGIKRSDITREMFVDLVDEAGAVESLLKLLTEAECLRGALTNET